MSAAAQQKLQLSVKLSVVKGPHAGQSFQINKDKIMIGRGPENDIVLMNDPQVSRSHAQIILADRDFEIFKISQKNAVLVDGDSVDQWKLVNGSTFVVGDTEIKFEYDLGPAIVSVPQNQVSNIIPLKPKPAEATQVNQAPMNKNQTVSKKASPSLPPVGMKANLPPQRLEQQVQRPAPMAPQSSQQFSSAYSQNQARTVSAPKTSLFDNPLFKFYAIAAIVIFGLVFFVMGPAKTKANKIKPTLKYEDEINIKLNSTTEKEKINNREETKKDRNSPQHLRAEENFIKGMRDYQLGNYLRAMEFFQVVLNLESDHQLARRHLYLSKVRFDELVQTKLMLGESYYSKHNFNMCASMYQQVMDMLSDKKSDSKYKLAEKKNNECELASEGIR